MSILGYFEVNKGISFVVLTVNNGYFDKVNRKQSIVIEIKRQLDLKRNFISVKLG